MKIFNKNSFAQQFFTSNKFKGRKNMRNKNNPKKPFTK